MNSTRHRYHLPNPPTHAPERDLDPVASALAGVDVYRAACRCGELAGPPLRDSADLQRAFTLHMRAVRSAA